MEARSFGVPRPCLLRRHPHQLQQGFQQGFLFFSHLSPPRRCLSSVNTKASSFSSCKDVARAQVKPAAEMLPCGARDSKRKATPCMPSAPPVLSTVKYVSLLLCRALLVAGIGLSFGRPALAQSSSPAVVEVTVGDRVAEIEDQKSAVDKVAENPGGTEALQTVEDEIPEAEAPSAASAKVEETAGAIGAETGARDTVAEAPSAASTKVEETAEATGAETGVQVTVDENVLETGIKETIEEKVAETGDAQAIDKDVAEVGVKETSEEKVVTEDEVDAERGAQKEDHGLGINFWKDSELVQGSIEFILKGILDGDPTNVGALECLGKRLVENDDYNRALLIFEELEALQPNEVQWKFMKAQALDMVGQPQSSKQTFLNVLRLEPFSAKALQGLLIVMDQLGEEEQAFQMLEKTIGKAKKEKKLQEAREIGLVVGQFLMLKGYLHEALEQYDELVEEDVSDFRPYLCQGIVYSLLGDKQMADQRFKSYDALCPKDLPDRKLLDGMIIRAKKQAARIDEMKKQKARKIREAKQKQSQKQAPKVEQLS